MAVQEEGAEEGLAVLGVRILEEQSTAVVFEIREPPGEPRWELNVCVPRCLLDGAADAAAGPTPRIETRAVVLLLSCAVPWDMHEAAGQASTRTRWWPQLQPQGCTRPEAGFRVERFAALSWSQCV